MHRAPESHSQWSLVFYPPPTLVFLPKAVTRLERPNAQHGVNGCPGKQGVIHVRWFFSSSRWNHFRRGPFRERISDGGPRAHLPRGATARMIVEMATCLAAFARNTLRLFCDTGDHPQLTTTTSTGSLNSAACSSSASSCQSVRADLPSVVGARAVPAVDVPLAAYVLDEHLFVVAQFAVAPTIFTLRGVCKAWLVVIDQTNGQSSEWRELLVASKVQAGAFASGVDLRSAYILLVCEPRALLASCSRLLRDLVSNPCVKQAGVSAHTYLKLVSWILRVGVCAACEWSVQINHALPRTEALNDALALGPYVYSFGPRDAMQSGRRFWQEESATFAECVAYRTKDEPDERKARVQASFNSTIRKISQRVLHRCFIVHAPTDDIPMIAEEQVGEQAMKILRDGHSA